ncbi:uncharacterized protein MELLADRAFT_84170 [Melampsora larici-populina 98AG31]|uniref:Uncharacterized protein n=1 Tax=Melampsora larici-populina (strain 98AG31 / pathotype 3-4-7) TaxID=747676 RepID=F4SBS1_MELLP|nr:uncharacterized protein MELLADRAFT_84170 [Melampsora larici-populina 98AG31]EGF97915.1 hypothetical protein MELLADRAFT_84170 [Melampsora larici-populina 98AG31]
MVIRADVQWDYFTVEIDVTDQEDGTYLPVSDQRGTNRLDLSDSHVPRPTKGKGRAENAALSPGLIVKCQFFAVKSDVADQEDCPSLPVSDQRGPNKLDLSDSHVPRPTKGKPRANAAVIHMFDQPGLPGDWRKTRVLVSKPGSTALQLERGKRLRENESTEIADESLRKRLRDERHDPRDLGIEKQHSGTSANNLLASRRRLADSISTSRRNYTQNSDTAYQLKLNTSNSDSGVASQNPLPARTSHYMPLFHDVDESQTAQDLGDDMVYCMENKGVRGDNNENQGHQFQSQANDKMMPILYSQANHGIKSERSSTIYHQPIASTSRVIHPPQIRDSASRSQPKHDPTQAVASSSPRSTRHQTTHLFKNIKHQPVAPSSYIAQPQQPRVPTSTLRISQIPRTRNSSSHDASTSHPQENVRPIASTSHISAQPQQPRSHIASTSNSAQIEQPRVSTSRPQDNSNS